VFYSIVGGYVERVSPAIFEIYTRICLLLSSVNLATFS